MLDPEDFRARYAAARAGDVSAREWLAQSLGPELVAYVRGKCGPEVNKRSSPEDIAQDALVRFFAAVSDYPRELDLDGVRARLFQLAKWSLLQLFQRPPPPRRESSLGDDSRSGLDPATPQPSSGPVTVADEARGLRETIARLQSPFREVLELRLVEGLDNERAARSLGISAEAARKRYERAVAHVRELRAAQGED